MASGSVELAGHRETSAELVNLMGESSRLAITRKARCKCPSSATVPCS